MIQIYFDLFMSGKIDETVLQILVNQKKITANDKKSFIALKALLDSKQA